MSIYNSWSKLKLKELDNKVSELLKRTKMTRKSRYKASERLATHQKVSQWIVAFISCTLVFIPLIQVFEVEITISNQLLNSFQSILAVMILVYSLLLGQENFVSKSEAMHRSGVELGKFARKLKIFENAHDDQKYSELVEEYYAILEKYENHKHVDYLFAKLYYKSEYSKGWIPDIGLWIKAYVLQYFGFIHYLFAVSVVFIIFYNLFNNIKIN